MYGKRKSGVFFQSQLFGNFTAPARTWSNHNIVTYKLQYSSRIWTSPVQGREFYFIHWVRVVEWSRREKSHWIPIWNMARIGREGVLFCLFVFLNRARRWWTWPQNNPFSHSPIPRDLHCTPYRYSVTRFIQLKKASSLRERLDCQWVPLKYLKSSCECKEVVNDILGEIDFVVDIKSSCKMTHFESWYKSHLKLFTFYGQN